MKRAILLGLVVLFLLFTPVYAGVENLTAEVGSYYIDWTWNYTNNTTSCLVWIDGSFETETSLNSFVLNNLNPRELHRIALINATNTSEVYATSEARTYYPPFIFYLLLILAIGFLIMTLIISEPLTSIITGVLGFVLGIVSFKLSYSIHYGILSYLCLGVAILCFLWLVIAIITILTKEEEEFGI